MTRHQLVASLGFGVLALIHTNDGYAEDFAAYSSFSIMGSFVDADTDRLTDDATGGSLSLDLRATEVWEIGLRALYVDYDDGDTLPGYSVSGLGVGFNAYPFRNLGLYLRASASVANETFLNAGLGYYLPLGERIALRAEALYHVADDSNEGGFTETLYNVGIAIPFHKSEPPSPAPTRT